MICDPIPSDTPSAGASSATEKGTAKAALALFLIGIALLAVAGVVGGVYKLRQVLFLENPRYRIRTVEVANEVGLVPRDEVLRRLELTDADLGKGRYLYNLDLEKQRKAFLADNPEIADFTLERYPPDRIRIVLHEKFPVARLGSGGLVVDEKGRSFRLPTIREDLVNTLPMLISENFASIRPGDPLSDDDQVALRVLRVMRLQQNPPLGFRIEEIDLTGEVYLDLTTDNNHLIRIPRDTLATEKSVGRDLHLAAATIATGRAGPGATFYVEPGEDGKSRVFLSP